MDFHKLLYQSIVFLNLCSVKSHVLKQCMHGPFYQQDTTWPEFEPSSALRDTSSFNLRGLGLLDTSEASIKCGYTPPPPNTCTQNYTQLTPILLKGLNRDNPARTPSNAHSHFLLVYVEVMMSLFVCQYSLTYLETNDQLMWFNNISIAYRSNVAIRSLTIT